MKRITFPLAFTAELIGVPAWTLREWCRKGIIPALKIARNYLIPRTWIEDFIVKAGGDPAGLLDKVDQAVTA